VTLTSKAFPWVHPREVFTCESAFNQEKSLKQQPALWTCVQTLKKMVLSADQQWYFKINWPLISDKTIKKEIAAIDRELRIFAIRSRNVYDSAFSKESLFQVQAGVTQSEKFEQVAINYSNWPKSNLLKIPPSREKVQEPALSLEFDDMRLIIQSFAADELVGRQKQSPMAIKPTVDLQFVAADNLTDPQFLETEFREQRTGVQGFLRPWQLATSLEYNSMTSNRGEQDSFFSLPSFDLAYQSDIYKIQAGFHLTTGILHFGSTLSVQEMQVNLRRQIEIIPHLQAVVGYHRYALNGKNPGSSRLGKMDAAVIGMSGFKTSDESFIQGKFLFLVSDAVGFDSQLTYGRYFDNRSDLRFYWGGFLGSAKYASTLINRMLESETFTEERLRVGISFGLIGPDFIEMN
jgi:hypothetical protein